MCKEVTVLDTALLCLVVHYWYCTEAQFHRHAFLRCSSRNVNRADSLTSLRMRSVGRHWVSFRLITRSVGLLLSFQQL